MISTSTTEQQQNPSPSHYQSVSLDVEDDDRLDDEEDDEFSRETPNHRTELDDSATSTNALAAKHTRNNFLTLAVLFSTNHGCVVSCLALATSRLGIAIGSYQSSLLMASYAVSAVSVATVGTKVLGARNGIVVGMALYGWYVGCFWVATKLLKEDHDHDPVTEDTDNDPESPRSLAALVAYSGALVGGLGAGLLWTAQGTYFGQAGHEHARCLGKPTAEESNALFAGYFAAIYLSIEVVLRLLSTLLLASGGGRWWPGASWETVFGLYTLLAVGSTLAVPLLVRDYPPTDDGEAVEHRRETAAGGGGHEEAEVLLPPSTHSAFRCSPPKTTAGCLAKATVAARLLRDDPKMKHMIGLNAVFGFASSFLNSYVNGQVLPVALHDPDSKYVGVLTSTISVVAAGMSLLFGSLGSRKSRNSGSGSGSTNNNGRILILGALCFGGVVLPFWVQPDATVYGWASLLGVYALHGTGRATFEGALRSTFADYFASEKEGAFANIVLQNGLANALGYVLAVSLTCETPSKYCIEYRNGRLHDVGTFEVIALLSVVVAIAGYLRAAQLFRREVQLQSLSGTQFGA